MTSSALAPAAGEPMDAPDVDGQAGPMAAYRERLRRGLLTPDPEQERVALRLEALFEALRAYEPAATSSEPESRMRRLGRFFTRSFFTRS